MEIYILRDGKEIGPFSEETTQTMLKQGSIQINDLAWQPGMPQWTPLHGVLYPAVSGTTSERPPPPPSPLGIYAGTTVSEPAAAVVNEAPPQTAVAEPATAKQKAFLSFMRVPFSPDVTRDQAAMLVNDALENPTDPGRLARWNDERLRLHPELFRAEIQAKKENRAAHFFEAAQTVGAEVFRGVTKAHCQVLVGFLDVRYPSWDTHEQQATWDYFFPAIAEKFPQLVNKEWKGKLKYPDGPKVAPELARRAFVKKPKRTGFPIAAIARGILVGGGILALLYFGYDYWRKGRGEGSRGDAKTVAQVDSQNARATNPATGDASANATAGLEKLLAQMPPPSATGADAATAGRDGGAPSPSNANTGAMGAGAGSAPGAATTSNANTTAPLFDPGMTANGAGTAAVTTTTTEAAAHPPRTTLIITKPTEVALRFGRVKLPPGTVVRFVGQEGTLLRIRYGNDVVTVPATSTDFHDLPPVPPAVPGPLPPTPAPLAPAPTIPAPAVPPTTPPTSPTSLF